MKSLFRLLLLFLLVNASFAYSAKNARAPSPSSAEPHKDPEFDIVTMTGLGNPPRYSKYHRVNIPQSRGELIRTALYSELLDTQSRVTIEDESLDTTPATRIARAKILYQLPMGFHQQEYFLALLHDFWSQYSQKRVELEYFTNEGERRRVSGIVVDIVENGNFLDPYITLKLDKGFERTYSLRYLSLGHFIETFEVKKRYPPRNPESTRDHCRRSLNG